jgi:hypothetical protein
MRSAPQKRSLIESIILRSHFIGISFLGRVRRMPLQMRRGTGHYPANQERKGADSWNADYRMAGASEERVCRPDEEGNRGTNFSTSTNGIGTLEPARAPECEAN